jgi:rubrerythrin
MAIDEVQSRPDGAFGHAEIDHGVVFEFAARNAGDGVGGELFDFLAGDEARHVQRVDAAIGELAETPAWAGS